jgi:hypothetical protein
LKLSKVLMVEEVEGPLMHPNKRLIPLQKWYDPCDIHLTGEAGRIDELGRLIRSCPGGRSGLPGNSSVSGIGND